MSETERRREQGKNQSKLLSDAVFATGSDLESQAEFIKRGLAAIEETLRLDNGIPADVVIAKLEAKLAAARKAKDQ